MVQILGEFPKVHQTFNLVPSMLVQIEEYASGRASDPFLDCAILPAEHLTEPQRSFVMRYLFQANVGHMIYRYPRYRELYEMRERLSVQELRDLQVLSQLVWFDEDLLARDPELIELVRKGRGYSLEDQSVMARKQREALGRVLPAYREFSARKQIEISATPFYHPTLPLICDSDIAAVAHPGVPLPQRFSYPGDAREQLSRTRSYMQEKLGTGPVAVGGFGLRSGARVGCRMRLHLGRQRQRRARADARAGGRLRVHLSSVFVAPGKLRNEVAVPGSLLERPDRLPIPAHGRGAGRGPFPDAGPPELRRPPVAGAHHPGWRKCVGGVPGEWASLSARAVPPDLR
jgi:hypothetical protein